MIKSKYAKLNLKYLLNELFPITNNLILFRIKNDLYASSRNNFISLRITQNFSLSYKLKKSNIQKLKSFLNRDLSFRNIQITYTFFIYKV